MSEKKFYWLKLKEDFFKSKSIKKLRKIAGGDTFTIIYLKMQLLSLKSEGKLFFENIEETFAQELALELDEEIENVEVTINFLQKHNLLEILTENQFILPQTIDSIGREGTSAERMRRLRDKKASLSDDIVTPLLSPVTLSDNNVCDSDTEIRDKRKEKEKDKNSCAETQEKTTATTEINISDIKHFYENNGFGLITGYVVNDMNSYIDKDNITCGLIIKALEEAVVNNIPKWSYSRSILQACAASNVTTVQQFEAKKAQHEVQKKLKSVAKEIPQHNNFEQREHEKSYYEDFFEKFD